MRRTSAAAIREEAGDGVPMFGPDSPVRGLLAQVDWAASALGPIREWPPELRAIVGACVSSPFPMLVMWGAQLGMVYNDAFVPILGAKHPALGLPGEQVWAEAWDVVGPMLSRVLDLGEPTYLENLPLILQRHGFDEEVYFTFSYSAIAHGDRVGGVLVVVSETTGNLLAAWRMRTLQDLGAERAVHSADAGQACARAMRVLDGHRADLPFAAVYLLDQAEGRASLVVASGLAEPSTLPAVLPCGQEWDWLWRSIESDQPATRTGVADRMPGLARAGASPAGDAPVHTMLALPLVASDQGQVRGVLVAGTSPYLQLDDDYRGFLSLVARQTASAITDAESYAAERRRADELAELDRAKTEFFTGVSHELRTPLTLIAGPAEDGLADSGEPLPPGQRRRMEIIHRNAGRMRRQVDMLLDFAKIESGRLQPEPVAVDLGELTRGIAESFAPAAGRAGLAFTVDCPSEGRPVLIDPDLWEKIVLNLLSNAVKFTFSGEIRISLHQSRDTVELRVRDTGVGIPAEEIPRLAERFHRVRGVVGRSHEGSGIGLALVHELTALHGGDVEVTSSVGQGTTVTLRIPARPAPGPAAPSPATGTVAQYTDEAVQWSAPVSTVGPDAVLGDRLLIADDNADLRQYLTGLLGRAYTVSEASDGRQALALARSLRPDLILADVMMPGLDGLDLLRALRVDPLTAAIPVILLSARAGQQAAVDGLAAGADDYLVKPFSSVDLLARVRSNLDLARARNHESAWRTALVNSLQDGFFVATHDARIVEVNDAFTTLLGYDDGDLPIAAPHPWWPRQDEDPHGFALVSAGMASVLATGRGRFTLPLTHRQGHKIWADVAIDAVRDRDGHNQLLVGTIHDITTEHLAAERDATLVRISGMLAGADGTAHALRIALVQLRDLWHADQCSLIRWDRSGCAVTTATTRDTDGIRPELPAEAQSTARTGRTVTNPAATPDSSPLTGVGVPIPEGADVALLWLEFDRPRPFPFSDRTLLLQLGVHLQQVLGRTRAYEEQRQVSLALQRSILGPAALPDGFAVHYEPAGGTLEVGGD